MKRAILAFALVDVFYRWGGPRAEIRRRLGVDTSHAKVYVTRDGMGRVVSFR